MTAGCRVITYRCCQGVKTNAELVLASKIFRSKIDRDNKGDDMDNTDLKKLSEIATTFLKEVDLIEAKAPNYTNTYSTMYLVNVVKIFFECLMKKHSEGDVEHHLEIEENLFIDNEADQNDEVRSHILERSLKHKRKYPYN